MGCEIAEKEGHHINMYTRNLNNIFMRKKIFEKTKIFLLPRSAIFKNENGRQKGTNLSEMR